MSTLKTQYQDYLDSNPSSPLSWTAWLEKLNQDLQEATKEWDVTLMDGLENEPPYVSDDFQIGPKGAYEHVDSLNPKVTFTFDYHDHSREIREVLNAPKWQILVSELDQKLRSVVKYGSPICDNETGEASELEVEACEKIREYLRSLLHEYELNLD